MSPLRSSLARSVGKLLGVFKDTDLSLRGDTSGTRYVPPPFRAIAATGGTTFTNGGYKYHVYTTTGSPQPFNVTDAGSSTNIEYLIIAGGGGGADRGNGAGGGGAGGVLGYGMELPSTAHQGGLVTVTVQDYALVVGAGGQGAPENSGGEGSGDNGSPSTAFGKTAVGGGGGGQNNVTQVLVEMVDQVVVEMTQKMLVLVIIIQDQLNRDSLVERLEVELEEAVAVALVALVKLVMLLPIQVVVELV